MSTLLRPAPARPYRRGNVHVRAGRMHSAPPGEKGSGSQMPAPAVRPRPSRSIRARRPYAGAMPECGRSGPHRVGVQSRLRIRKLASLGQFVSSGATPTRCKRIFTHSGIGRPAYGAVPGRTAKDADSRQGQTSGFRFPFPRQTGNDLRRRSEMWIFTASGKCAILVSRFSHDVRRIRTEVFSWKRG